MTRIQIAPRASQSSVLDQVDALRSLIERSAPLMDENACLTDEVIQALESAGIFHLMVPEVLGGGEADPQTLIEVLRKLSYFDGSTGWYSMASMVAGGIVGAYLGDRAVDEIFGGKSTCAGQAQPLGKAERVGDGYRIAGSFSFGSGSSNAAWLLGGYVLHVDGSPVRDAGGAPTVILAVAPRSKVEFLGNWDVMGLRGTASYDYKVLDQIVHEDFTMTSDSPQPRRGGAIYAMGRKALTALSHAAFPLGCGSRVLDELATLSRTKRRGPNIVGHQPTFQRDFAYAAADLRAAAAYVSATFGQAFEIAKQGIPIPREVQIDGRLCASHAVSAGERVARTAYLAATTTALRNGTTLQRCYRDLNAGIAHTFTGEQSYIDVAKNLIGLPDATINF